MSISIKISKYEIDDADFVVSCISSSLGYTYMDCVDYNSNALAGLDADFRLKVILLLLLKLILLVCAKGK